MNLRFEQTYRVKAYEVGPNAKLTAGELCNYLQDVAELHARELGLSTGQLPENLTWMLTALKWNVSRFPEWRDETNLKTWPSGLDRLYAYRDFEATDTSGNTWMTGSSRWILLDVERKRPVRLIEEVQRIEIPTENRSQFTFEKLVWNGPSLYEQGFTVRRSDMDLLQHTNNAVYASWISESLPDEVVNHQRICAFEIRFSNESVQGDPILVQSSREKPDTYIHRVIRTSDEVQLAVARTCWE